MYCDLFLSVQRNGGGSEREKDFNEASWSTRDEKPEIDGEKYN